MTSADPAVSSPPPSRLAWSTQVGYASADFGLSAVEIVLRLYLLKYYTDVVGLGAGWAGLALAIGLLIDAVTDPLMGEMSDRTKARIGRRPYLIAGAIVLSAGSILVFRPISAFSEPLKFLWLLGTYSLLNVGLTVLAVPFTAMSGELSTDRHERSVLFGWRAVFANAGALFAAALPTIFDSGRATNPADSMSDGRSSTPTDGAGTAAAESVAAADKSVASLEVGTFAVAAAVMITAALAFFATRRVVAAKDSLSAAAGTAAENFRAVMTCRPFRPLLFAYLIAMTGLGLNTALALYFYEYHLELDKNEVNQLLVIVMGTFTLSVPFWVTLSKRLGKNPPLVGGTIAFGAGTCIVYPLLPVGSFMHVVLFAAVLLGTLVGSSVLLDSLLTDVIDYDRVRGGPGRAGVYFGGLAIRRQSRPGGGHPRCRTRARPGWLRGQSGAIGDRADDPGLDVRPDRGRTVPDRGRPVDPLAIHRRQADAGPATSERQEGPRVAGSEPYAGRDASPPAYGRKPLAMAYTPITASGTR